MKGIPVSFFKLDFVAMSLQKHSSKSSTLQLISCDNWHNKMSLQKYEEDVSKSEGKIIPVCKEWKQLFGFIDEN